MNYNQLVVASSCTDPPCLLNYEVEREHSIRVVVTDTGHPPLSREFTKKIIVLDVDDLPYGTTLVPDVLMENQPHGTEIGEYSSWG